VEAPLRLQTRARYPPRPNGKEHIGRSAKDGAVTGALVGE